MQERNKVALTKKEKDVILGTLLGDGYLNKRGNNIRLQMVHGPKQEKYIKWKALKMNKILTDRGVKFEIFRDKYAPNKIKKCWSFYTGRHEYLDYLYNLLYKCIKPPMIKTNQAQKGIFSLLSFIWLAS